MKNYNRYAFLLALLVVALLVFLRALPDSWSDRAEVKRVDIFADLKKKSFNPEDASLVSGLSVGIDTIASDTISLIYIEQQSAVPEGKKSGSTAASPASKTAGAESVDTPLATASETPVLDYSGGAMLQGFLDKLNQKGLGRPVRIAFMGDSFIEGDLLTSDFRELMQNAYGGGGVGFVPITSQVAGFRQTVKHSFNEWGKQSIVTTKEASFPISAFNYTPQEGSFVEYRGSKNKKHLDRFDRARLLFLSKGHSTVRALVNGEEKFTFETEPSDVLQEIELTGGIQSVRYSVSKVEGFTAYGVFLENSSGVCVDNLSVRGNSGIPMGRVNLQLNQQLNKLAPYDLIVLQYGLNVVSANATNYATYQSQMMGVVARIRECFPEAAILVMSVGDRSTRVEGEFVTMPGIKALAKNQQEVAHQSKVLFWNTYQAMVSLGGMPVFVKNGWAAKDYTHISAQGGKKIAAAFFQGLTSAAAQ